MPLKFVDQVNRDFILTVSKRAVFTVLAGSRASGVTRTKFGFVLFRVVKDFNVIVRVYASVLIWTMFLSANVITNLWFISSQITTAVFCSVVEVRTTLLVVVFALLRALICFVKIQIQKFAGLSVQGRSILRGHGVIFSAVANDLRLLFL